MIADQKVKNLAKRLVEVSKTDGLVDETKVKEILDHLRSSKRANLRQILTAYLFYMKREVQNSEILVEHAGPVSAETLENLRSTYSDQYGRPLRLRSVENSKLIAGMRIQVGDDLIDGSIAARLKALENTL